MQVQSQNQLNFSPDAAEAGAVATTGGDKKEEPKAQEGAGKVATISS